MNTGRLSLRNQFSEQCKSLQQIGRGKNQKMTVKKPILQEGEENEEKVLKEVQEDITRWLEIQQATEIKRRLR